jgi:hypothetical protein
MAESLTSSAPGTFNTGSPSTIGNAFSPTGSPPIIVAFLAVGLFVAGMLSVRFWRLNRARGTIQEARSVAAGGRVVGEKPVLWDLWLDEPIKSRARWGDIMVRDPPIIPHK